MKKFLAIFSLFVGLVFLTACSTSSSSTEVELSSMPKIEGITYHGDIPKNPKKVVNFAYSYTGYLLQLGIDVSSYSLDLEKNSPAFGDKLKDVPQLTTADTEAIAAQKPDVILVFAGDDNLETLKEIAPVIEITYGKSDYLKMLTDVGQIFGKEKEAQAWLDQWDKKVATAKEELKGLIDTSSTFTVMDFFDKNIFLYGNNFGRGGFGRGGELVYRALGFAAPAKVQEDIINKEGWFGVSQEALPEYVGDYVLVNVNDKTKEAAASLKESDIWKNLPAVKNGHVIEVDYNLFYFSDPISLDLQIDAFVSAIQKLQ
ncbi:TPA: ABC transporter substrate-binding protein [Streptococcus suis]|nr:ABC transporter substrate-binding protein [Streptococcus suis]